MGGVLVDLLMGCYENLYIPLIVFLFIENEATLYES